MLQRNLTLPTASDIETAAGKIGKYLRRTPVLDLPGGDFGLRNPISLKLDFMQHAGSFKTRGAFNNLLNLASPSEGVCAPSGGNHGASVAYAARQLGIKALIFVPEISDPSKIAAIRSFGADIIIGGKSFDDAQAACDAYVAKTGTMKVHPFATVNTIVGQGTVGHEWDAQCAAGAPLDTVLVAVGGGGLVSGAATWWKNKGVKVVGVEPEGSCSLHAALANGGPVDVMVKSIAADSLGPKNVGELVYAICSQAVDHVALVPDSEILAAQKNLWDKMRLVSEPGGAAALAALTSGAYKPEKDERVGVLLCGANIDLGKFLKSMPS